MENIKFKNYTPPKPPADIINLTIGVFFDGTKNNKNNTKERESGSSSYKNYGGELGDNNSYNNDWSNVARLWDTYDKKNALYIEGIGTEDKKGDEIQGYAFGSGATGIRAKVRKGCEKIVTDKIAFFKKNNPQKRIGTITLDVFGFSRGAAAARNFVYEINKSKYKSIPQISPGESGEIYYTDSNGYRTNTMEFPARGHFGLKLEEQGIKIENVKVRFLGLFDTVSSYHENISLKPKFSNDVKELNLNSIEKAKSVVHFTAENEHRENFDLTRTHVGKEKEFPGVHSDVGGGYLGGKEVVEEIETSWTLKTRLEPIRKRLIAEGWYKEKQLSYTGGAVYWALQGTRKIEKHYSFIPLHFMAEIAKNQNIPFQLAALTSKYDISPFSVLQRVKKRLRNYVMSDGKPYKFRWYGDIHKKYEKNKADPKYLAELDEQDDLRFLRNNFLHWSANRKGIGMDPRNSRLRVTR